nr:hypothetical protein [Sphingomonas tagetis]
MGEEAALELAWSIENHGDDSQQLILTMCSYPQTGFECPTEIQCRHSSVARAIALPYDA